MGINVQFETDVFIKALGMRGNELQITAADTLNESAEEIKRDYLNLLEKNQTVRTNFTRNAVRVFKSNPIRRSGEPRPLGKINSIVAIKKMKGGSDHYLTKLENGGKIQGNKKTANRVPVPLDAARTGKNNSKSIAVANRLTKGEPQTLRTPGGTLGVRGDGYRDPRQRFAILQSYKKRGGSDLSGNLSKPFFFIDMSDNLAVFKFIGRRLAKIRSLEFKSLFRRARPHFESAFNHMPQRRIQVNFIRKARKAIKNLP